MESSLYVSLSGQVSMERRLNTIARNVANMNTAGYRADEVKFDSLVTSPGRDKIAFASEGATYISRQAGAIEQTGNALDVAISGEGWLAMRTGNGVAYTRDGRMQLGVDGVLRSVTGNAILDAGEAEIALDPLGGRPTIGKDGTIMQGNRRVGVIGLFSIDPQAKLSRVGNSGVVPDRPAEPILDFVNNGIEQGYVEGSNVNPIMEISKLIEVTRTFDSTNSAVQGAEDVRRRAIRELGGG
ncbi:flagellar basal-body rod protein FlgF [Polycladidibacter hongkongensis]|uniref:flagellar basal-body rod protein FlgF n=1 Tax=Polycladidibacter hongkongensis TaxID=1647556 RepID=UPI00082A8DB9|nr:flagellar basal-body rod protein FlgF [Pseudovibrio hongkongensis]